MRQPILQACGNRELETMVTSTHSRISLLSGHDHIKAAVNINCRVDRSLVVVGIPSITGNKITVGDIMVALIIRRATSATGGSRSIHREICICPAKFHCYCVRLTVSEAGRSVENESVV